MLPAISLLPPSCHFCAAGSSRVAEKLARDLHGRIKIEDAGFDWKVLGPDVSKADLDYVAWTCDQVRSHRTAGRSKGSRAMGFE